MTPEPIVLSGEALEFLRELPDDSIDAIVTDPPYGLSNTDPAHVAEAITKWVSGEREYVPHKRGGFMGKEWDSFVPPPAVWDECLRVLKPGGHLLTFAGTRTMDLMTLGLRLAGFEIRDSVAWLYGSGFPKSLNVARAVDAHVTLGGSSQTKLRQRDMGEDYRPHTSAGTEGFGDGNLRKGADGDRDMSKSAELISAEAQQWEGWGTALKPAFEPIVVARKPFKGSVAKNVLDHGTGALNVDATRVGQPDGFGGGAKGAGGNSIYGDLGGYKGGDGFVPAQKGRWPANVVLGHTDDCVQVGTRKIKAITGTNSGRGAGTKAEESDVYGKYAGRTDIERGAAVGFGDADGMEEVEWYECAPGCPVAELDAQSGTLKSGKDNRRKKDHQTDAMAGTLGTLDREEVSYGDTGGASRFFYCSKAPKKERPVLVDVEGKRTVHPTVKPLALMRWLLRLVAPPGGIVLDPFVGSGTTIEAGMLEGIEVWGIEGEEDYLPLIQQRIDRVISAHHAPSAEERQ